MADRPDAHGEVAVDDLAAFDFTPTTQLVLPRVVQKVAVSKALVNVHKKVLLGFTHSVRLVREVNVFHHINRLN